MTNKEALRAAMAPYVLPKSTIEFLLIEQELYPDEEYDNSLSNELYKAVINALNQVRTLTKEKDPGTENNYDVTQIDKLIDYYQKKIDPLRTDQMFIDRTEEW